MQSKLMEIERDFVGVSVWLAERVSVTDPLPDSDVEGLKLALLDVVCDGESEEDFENDTVGDSDSVADWETEVLGEVDPLLDGEVVSDAELV